MDFIEAIKYFILGLIQGITEVLPISSSGHVELVKAIIHIDFDQDLLFLILVNTGSLVTMILLYFKRLYSIIKDFFLYWLKKSSRETTRVGFGLTLKLVIATIPAVIVGFAFKSTIETLMVQYNVLLSGIGLILTGNVLFLVSAKRIRRGFTQITYKDAILVGIAQSIALIPGVSRSGMTTATAINNGMGIDSALNFSFLMYIPVSIGSLILSVKDVFDGGITISSSVVYVYYFLAFFAAAIATYVAYKLVFNIFKSGKLKYFGVYCIIIGLLSIGLFIFR